MKKKIFTLILCATFAVFLSFFLGYSFGRSSRGFVVQKGETATGLMPVAVSPAEEGIAPIDLNTATKEELITIPGIGETYAEQIIAMREEKGPFTSVWELDVIPGIGEAKLAQIEPYVKFS